MEQRRREFRQRLRRWIHARACGTRQRRTIRCYSLGFGSGEVPAGV